MCRIDDAAMRRLAYIRNIKAEADRQRVLREIEEAARMARVAANRARGKRRDWVEPDQSPEARAARMAAYRQKAYARSRS